MSAERLSAEEIDRLRIVKPAFGITLPFYRDDKCVFDSNDNRVAATMSPSAAAHVVSAANALPRLIATIDAIAAERDAARSRAEKAEAVAAAATRWRDTDADAPVVTLLAADFELVDAVDGYREGVASRSIGVTP